MSKTMPILTNLWIQDKAVSDTSINQEKTKRMTYKKVSGYTSLFMFLTFAILIYTRDFIFNVQRGSAEFDTFGIAILSSLFISLIAIASYFAYSEIISEFEPIAGEKECAELMYWSTQNQEIANRVALIQQQNRQAYKFDYTNAKFYMTNQPLQFSKEEIEQACKRLHAVN